MEEKNKKFEKVRTPIIEELAKLKSSDRDRRKEDKKFLKGSAKLITKTNQTKFLSLILSINFLLFFVKNLCDFIIRIINMDAARTDYSGHYEKVYYEKKKNWEKEEKKEEKSDMKKKVKKPKIYSGQKQVVFIKEKKNFHFFFR